MNAKRSLFILSLLLVAAGLPLAAQDRPWCEGDNITGIRVAAPAVKASMAELYGGYTGGGFRAAYDASSLWKVGARARTEVHSGKVSLAGGFSFEQRMGKDMMRSMFVHPGYFPFDVMEFTPGPKTLQQYAFDGGIAWQPAGRWTFGGKVSFEADNYAKRKDIRHTNYYQDISVLPAVRYSFGPEEQYHIGVNGLFRRLSESVQAEQIGTSAYNYYAFLDKGMMYGTYEVWDGSGVHLAEAGVNRFPVRELSWGGALQASVRDDWFAEFGYTRSAGEVGEKGYVWMRFPAEKLSLRLGARLMRGGRFTDRLSLECSRKVQRLDEIVVDRINDGGVQQPVSYTDSPNEVSRRSVLGMTLRYDLFGKGVLGHLRPEVGYVRVEERSTLVYPYVDEVTVHMLSADLNAGLRLGRVELGLRAGTVWGRDHSTGLCSVDESVKGVAVPYRMDGDWARRMEYMTAFRIKGGLSVRYPFTFCGVKGLYAGARFDMTHAPRITVLPGESRCSAAIQFGIKF